MRYPLRCLLLFVLALVAVSARAQLTGYPSGTGIIADPARSAAARDTLLRQAAQIRQRATEGSPVFVTNASIRPRRRVVVSGEVRPPAAPPATGPYVTGQSLIGQSLTGRPLQWVPGTLTWKHVTCYRRNGRVQEKFLLRLDNTNLLRQRWLNGAVTWLSMPVSQAIRGLPIRHKGLYLLTGYVRLDNEEYFLLPSR